MSDVAGHTMQAQSPEWRAFSAAAKPTLQNFESALQDPAAAQQEQLWRILRANAETQFGRKYGFSSVRSIQDFQRRVPESNWANTKPWVERAMSGEQGVLTSEEPVHYERTSGSGSQNKDIPYTPSLLREFQSALVVWLASLARDCPAISGPGYWSMSPDLSPPGRTAAGVSVGSVSDAVYLAGSPAEILLPTVVGGIGPETDGDDWQLHTLSKIVAESNLRLLSVWSPTFLLSLFDTLLDDARAERSLATLRKSLAVDRYDALLGAVDAQDFSKLWPQMHVVSCWTDGPSSIYSARLAELFPGSRFSPKGLFATEGVVSLSWGASTMRPVAITSHFLEFLDENGSPQLVEQLEVGRRYKPLLTTSGGLYRYCLGDIIEVTEFLERTPCIRFVGRDDHRSDLVGEKLDEQLVTRALGAAGLPDAAILIPIPTANPPNYLLVTESRLKTDAELVEAELCRAHHYSIARGNGQLAAVAWCNVSNMSDLLHESWQAAGRRSGDAKPVSLIVSARHAEALLRVLQDRGEEVIR